MKRNGYDTKSANVTTTTFTTVAEMPISSNIDRVVVAVYNAYTGTGVDTLTFRVLAQFVKDGEFLEVKQLTQNGGVMSIPGDLSKGQGFWGAIDDFGIEGIRVQALRPGTDPIPVIVEFKCLAQGEDG